MGGRLLRRLAAAALTVFAVVTLLFVAIHAAPGTPFLPAEGRPINPALEATLRQRFGLDQPLAAQYGHYLAALAHGDLGESFRQQRAVSAALRDAIPNTVLLAGTALLIDLLLGITLGVYQAARASSRTDAAITAATLLVYSLPTFWLGLLLLLVFGQWLHWFPVGGVMDPVLSHALSPAGRLLDRLHHLALPAFSLGLVGAAGTARFQRAAMLDVLGEDYVRTARAKGLAESRVLARHALRNALVPAVTLLGLALPVLLAGSAVVETVFAWPGMGKLAADAITSRDYPVVTATALVAGLMVVLGNLLADALQAALDPRVRQEPRP